MITQNFHKQATLIRNAIVSAIALVTVQSIGLPLNISLSISNNYDAIPVGISSAYAVPAAKTSSTKSTPSEALTAASDKKSVHRADFRVKGASCVACLRRISKTMREQKGVLKGDVSIFPPYWAIMIYDQNQTNMAKLYEAVAHEKVTFEDIEDRAITGGVPLIVIPKGLGQTDSGPGNKNSAPGK